MGGVQEPQITLEAAKARLLSASRDISVRHWVRRYPLKALSGALISGFIVGSSPGVQGKITETILELFVKQWFSKL
jgi:hypothetical protein